MMSSRPWTRIFRGKRVAEQKKHPYEGLDQRAYWKPAVAEKHYSEISKLYDPKFRITESEKIATAGSCFAQHIAHHLRLHSFNYTDFEPAPRWLAKKDQAAFGYGIYSARFGNIYTARQLLQLFQRAFEGFVPADGDFKQGGKVYDLLRPAIEPGGFGAQQQMEASRASHLASVRRMFQEADVFIFTFGLTEAWVSRIDGTVYPMCPGTVAGEFSPERYEFRNFGTADIAKDLNSFYVALKEINPKIRILLTVSPVPLTATASGKHVLTATTYSKSVLRAVAGEMERDCPDVAYFPSYEIITGSPFRGTFFDPNLREVNPIGVQVVMREFFRAHPPAKKRNVQSDTRSDAEDKIDQVCEEMLLGKYAQKAV